MFRYLVAYDGGRKIGYDQVMTCINLYAEVLLQFKVGGNNTNGLKLCVQKK